VLGAALAYRLRPVSDGVVDHSPARHWPDPVVDGEPSLEAGPIMVQVEYAVETTCVDAFRTAMTQLGRNRRRDGAIEWWLFQDTADPSRFVETWVEETWASHLRNHDRVSVAHKELEERVRDLTRKESTITTRHFVAPDARGPAATAASAAAAVRAVQERTGCWAPDGTLD